MSDIDKINEQIKQLSKNKFDDEKSFDNEKLNVIKDIKTDDVTEKTIKLNRIDEVEENSIIVIDNHNIDYCTVWGNILSRMAQIKNINGTIINGAMRDFKKSKEMNYPVYAKHINCKTGKGVVKLKSVISIFNILLGHSGFAE